MIIFVLTLAAFINGDFSLVSLYGILKVDVDLLLSKQREDNLKGSTRGSACLADIGCQYRSESGLPYCKSDVDKYCLWRSNNFLSSLCFSSLICSFSKRRWL